ncbi:MAG: response regulator transcription factor [Bacteroidetes bacterium]|nr:response regulator transcription factor [Bacteroidota bacterium]
MKLRCIIVDDDENSRSVIKHCVSKTEFLSLEGIYSSAKDALVGLKSKPADVIFLDVEMPEMSGIDFMKTFTDIPQVVIVTSKKEYAAEAYDYNVTDFVSKPIDYARFLKAAEKAREMHSSITRSEINLDEIFIKKDSRLIKLHANEINWIEALSDYVNIYTTGQRYTVLTTMKGIESKLPPKDFARVHRSYIIRIDKIKEIEENTVFIGENAIPISRSHKEALLKKLNLL